MSTTGPRGGCNPPTSVHPLGSSSFGQLDQVDSGTGPGTTWSGCSLLLNLPWWRTSSKVGPLRQSYCLHLVSLVEVNYTLRSGTYSIPHPTYWLFPFSPRIKASLSPGSLYSLCVRVGLPYSYLKLMTCTSSSILTPKVTFGLLILTVKPGFALDLIVFQTEVDSEVSCLGHTISHRDNGRSHTGTRPMGCRDEES